MILGASMLSASASTISVNFHVNGDADAPADHELAAGELAGLAPVGNWNNINIGTGGAHNTSAAIFSSTMLNDSTGASTGATLAPNVISSWFVGYAASNAATAAELGLAGNQDDLFNSYLALNGPGGDGNPEDEAVLTIANLPAAFTTNGYQLIIYSDTDRGPANGGDRTSVFTVTPTGGSAISVLTEDDGSVGAAAATFSGAFVLSDNSDTTDDYSNYTVINGLTADGFTIDVTSPNGGRGGISGFQLIANPVPEPSTSLLLGLMGVVTLIRRKR